MTESKVIVTIPGEERSWELVPLETSPCTLACPTRINARGYVSLIADGRYAEALALIRERNPFPGVCGRICPRPCESACRRGEFDEAIAVCALKRFVFDLEMSSGVAPAARARIQRKEKVAVIGAGPAGLSAAYDLVRAGYAVTIFEAMDEPGGMMNLIPAFRLPERIVKRETEIILKNGIELVTGTRFGKDVTWNTLKRRGYRAVLVATGAWRTTRRFSVKSAGRYYHALDLLRSISDRIGVSSELRKVLSVDVERMHVVVLGGGRLACDAARTAVRLGARSVKIVAGMSRELSPIGIADLDAAIDEGVKFVFLARATKLMRAGRRLKSVRCVRLQKGRTDATGRTDTEIREDSEFDIPADVVIDANPREIDLAGLAAPLRLDRTMIGTVAVDSLTMAAGMPGVFAAGDAVTGPRSVVEAIASGQKAARGIREYLEGKKFPSVYDSLADWERHKPEFSLERMPEEVVPRIAVPVVDRRSRRRDFEEVEWVYSARAAQREAQRCLRCGPCAECAVCTDICERKDLQVVIQDSELTVHADRGFWSGKTAEARIEIDGETNALPTERTVCRVQVDACIGCGRCEAVCRYSAARVNTYPGGRFVAGVDEIACKGCGNCVAVCPTGAMDQGNFERASLHGRFDGIERGVTGFIFVCRWGRPEMIHVPENVRVVEVMCTGRLTPALIVGAVRAGCSGVMVCGCSEDRCHYGDGRLLARATVRRARDILKLLGHDPRIVTEIDTDPREFNGEIRKWYSAIGSRKKRSTSG